MRETSSTLDDSRNGQCRQPRPTGFTIGGELINGQNVEVDSIGSWILRPSGSVAQILGIDLEVEVDSIGSWILRPNVNSAKNSNTHNHMGC